MVFPGKFIPRLADVPGMMPHEKRVRPLPGEELPLEDIPPQLRGMGRTYPDRNPGGSSDL